MKVGLDNEICQSVVEIQARCLPESTKEIENGKKKPGENSFSVSLDLTKRRYNLLKLAQGIVKEMDNVSFVCADANCSLAIRFKNGTIKHFNSEYEFRSLLNDNWFLLLLQFFLLS